MKIVNYIADSVCFMHRWRYGGNEYELDRTKYNT